MDMEYKNFVQDSPIPYKEFFPAGYYHDFIPFLPLNMEKRIDHYLRIILATQIGDKNSPDTISTYSLPIVPLHCEVNRLEQ